MKGYSSSWLYVIVTLVAGEIHADPTRLLVSLLEQAFFPSRSTITCDSTCLFLLSFIIMYVIRWASANVTDRNRKSTRLCCTYTVVPYTRIQ